MGSFFGPPGIGKSSGKSHIEQDAEKVFFVLSMIDSKIVESKTKLKLLVSLIKKCVKSTLKSKNSNICIIEMDKKNPLKGLIPSKTIVIGFCRPNWWNLEASNLLYTQ